MFVTISYVNLVLFLHILQGLNYYHIKVLDMN